MPRGVPGSGVKSKGKGPKTSLQQIQKLIDRMVQAELKARVRKLLK